MDYAPIKVHSPFFCDTFYFVSNNIISLLLFTNLLIASADNGWLHKTGVEFFGKQDFIGVAKVNGEVAGLYILHPNNVGRCGHHANASYAVSSKMRGIKIGEGLVKHSLKTARELGYRILIFNAVVKGNDRAIQLYTKLGFQRVGVIPGGFLLKSGVYQDIYVYYHVL